MCVYIYRLTPQAKLIFCRPQSPCPTCDRARISISEWISPMILVLHVSCPISWVYAQRFRGGGVVNIGTTQGGLW